MFVFPMAGLSSRFFKENYKLPKYMLPLKGKTVFEHAVGGFSNYFKDTKFLWITLEGEHNPKDFVIQMAQKLGVVNFEVVSLKEPTRGQAETVYMGLEMASIDVSEPVTIFNIDTFRPEFSYPKFLKNGAPSYLETFIGTGKNWSNVVPSSAGQDLVLSTSEKKEESEYCCTGLYHWQSYASFKRAYLEYLACFPDKELYVAPMYNYAIQAGDIVRFSVVDKTEVIFCGTPSEYESLLQN